MSRKTRKDKQIAQLRREVEILKAQLSTSTPTPEPVVAKKEVTELSRRDQRDAAAAKDAVIIDPAYLKKDLRRSLILTTTILIILGVLSSFIR